MFDILSSLIIVLVSLYISVYSFKQMGKFSDSSNEYKEWTKAYYMSSLDFSLFAIFLMLSIVIELAS